MYIEDLIHRLAVNGPYLFDTPIELLSLDSNIIYSLSNQIINGNSFTEKQANLAVKLAKKYQKKLSLALKIDLTDAVNSPTFKFPLRVISQNRSVTVHRQENGKTAIISVIFPFDDNLISKIKLYKRNLNLHTNTVNWNHEKKSWDFDLREDHVDWISKNLVNSSFLVDDLFKDFVTQIEEIKSNMTNYIPMVCKENNSYIFKNVSEKIPQPKDQNVVSVLVEAKKYGIYTWSDEIGEEIRKLNLNQNIYDILNDNKTTHINIKNEKVSITDLKEIIFNSLPLLVIIPGGSELAHLESCVEFFEKNNIDKDSMSVLFRLDGERGKTCNSFIKDSKINNPINENTKVVFICGKIPKPMIESKINFSLILNFGISGVHYVLLNYIKNHHFVINCNLRDMNFASL